MKLEDLSYDCNNGFILYKSKRVGSMDKARGYRSVNVDRKRYREHRLAWFLYYGNLPNENIDHINHKKDDNRISNLRLATPNENGKNQSLHRSNKSGFNGVHFDKRRNKWAVAIHVDGKTIRIGRYNNMDAAINARINANIKYGFHHNHGAVSPSDGW